MDIGGDHLCDGGGGVLAEEEAMTYRIATLQEVLASPPLLDAEGWLVHPDFIRVDGVPQKVYTEPNTGANGLAGHSVVGEEADYLDGVPNRFLSEEMVSPGTYSAYAAASCMFILRKRMKHVVMYPTDAATWTSGSRVANTTTWASEAEGGLFPNYGEFLTEHQMRGEIVKATAWEQKHKRRLTASDLNEHRHLVARFGGGATACASGRYSEVYERILNGERYIAKGADMTPDEVATIAAGQFLELLAQAIGAKDSTFSDTATVELIRNKLAAETVADHKHTLEVGQCVVATEGVLE